MHPSSTWFICCLLTGQKEAKSPAGTTALPLTTAPEPTTTTTPEPTTTTTTPAPTTTTAAPPPTTTKARAAVHKVRDAGEWNKPTRGSCIVPSYTNKPTLSSKSMDLCMKCGGLCVYLDAVCDPVKPIHTEDPPQPPCAAELKLN